MNSSLLSALNLDAATALALPLADVEARAQYRFCFRLPDGNEEWLLARLCVVEPDCDHDLFQHCVVLRPENAETTRTFVAENLWYRAGRRELDEWMTPAQAKRWKWDLFEQSFNDSRYDRRLARFWSVEEQGKTTLLKLGADGWSKLYSPRASDETPVEIERFIWQRKERGLSHESADLRFLRANDADFHNQILDLWKNSDGPIQYAVFWSQLSLEQKDAVAFKCERGDWGQLCEVASWVLTIRVAGNKELAEENLIWKFASYGEIEVARIRALYNDEALFKWRLALTEKLGAFGVDGAGVKIDSLPLCLWNYIDGDARTFIEIAPPTMHEAIEAQLKLRDWAGENCAPDEAARLLNCLIR